MLSSDPAANRFPHTEVKPSWLALHFAMLLLFHVILTASAFGQVTEIGSVAQLQLIGNDPAYPLDGNYILSQDIDASATAGWSDGAGFDPIGDATTPFAGTFDGQGYVIANLTIDRPGEGSVGLFGAVGEGSAIQNVGVQGGTVTGGSHVGGLVGTNSGTVSQCYATCAVTGGGWYVGGLVGTNSGTVSQCYTTGVVTGGGRYVGGLTGENEGSLSECYTTGAVTGGDYVGGLVGLNTGLVSMCYATGAVTVYDWYVGGLVGANSGAVSASFWDVGTSGQLGSSGGKGLTTIQLTTRSIYGNAGWGSSHWVMKEGEFPRLAWEGTGAAPLPASEAIPLEGSGTEIDPYRIRTAEDFAQLSWFTDLLDAHIELTSDLYLTGMLLYPIGDLGAFSGVFDGQGHVIHNARVDQPNSYRVGLFASLGESGEIQEVGVENAYVQGGGWVGALVGYNCGKVSGCYVTGEVTGGRIVGGLVGRNYGGTVSQSYSMGTVTSTWNNAGGLVGSNNTGTVSQCYATGTVTATGINVGCLIGTNISGTVSQSYATGAVTGSEYVGGLAGASSSGGMVSQCFATGVVTGNRYVGGLVGHSSQSTVSQCYATGTVRGTGDYMGGLLSWNDAGTVEVSFWDTETSGMTSSAGGTGLPTTQMQTQSTFIGAGWDFDTVWYMLEGGSYPYLGNLPQSLVPDASALSEADAIAALEAAGFVPRVRYESSETIPEGQVIRQDPVAASSVNAGITVNLVVSLGQSIISIAGIEELQQIGNDPNYPLDGKYILTQDIDASATAGWNGGAGFNPIGTFTGSFDGQGYVISGLVIVRPFESNVGLFQAIGEAGVIEALGLNGGEVAGDSYVGGLAGYVAGTVSQCYATGTVTGNQYVGGLVGSNSGGTVSQCYATGAVTGEDYLGGLVAWNDSGTVSQCYATGAVTGGWFGAGGLIGWNDSTVSECYATGTVTGDICVGGLVGWSEIGTVSQCYATGAVTGGYCVGGLVGDSSQSTVSQCYATGAVTADYNARFVGGLVGLSHDGGTVEASFWDVNTSGLSSSAGGTGLPTSQMQTLAVYTNAGWDLVNVWYMLAGGSYPYLGALPQSVVPDVSGMTRAEAIAALETARLLPHVTYEHNDTVPNGHVIRTSPSIGTSINTGTPVNLVVSLGLGVIPISSIEELQLIGNDPAYPLDGDYFLTQDIDASATAGWNNGAGFDPIGTFTGHFDGQGYEITGVVVNRIEGSVGLFRAVGETGLIESFGLNAGQVKGATYVGGLVGSNSGRLVSCYAKGHVYNDVYSSYVGGLVGRNEGNLTNCYTTGSASGAAGVGGLVGDNIGSVTRCYSEVIVSGFQDAGGLVGINRGDIDECFATGTVDLWDDEIALHSGGLVGNNSGTITQCLASGDVVYAGLYTCESLGGLIGSNEGLVFDCYSTGQIDIIHYGIPQWDIGGLLGQNSGVVFGSFWDTETSERSTSAGGAGLPTTQMQTLSTFTSAGWDFDTVWYMLEGGSYPYLGNLPQAVVAPVTGLSEAAAIDVLEMSGFSVELTYQHHNEVPEGQAIRTSPSTGSSINTGTTVYLVVSLGPGANAVPYVMYMDLSQAQSSLVNAGFVVGTVRHGFSETVPAGAVMAQVPAAGEFLSAGSPVSFTISNGIGQGPGPQPANPAPAHEGTEISLEPVFAWDVQFTESFEDGISDGWGERPDGSGLWTVDVDPLSGSLAYQLSGSPTTPEPWRLAEYSLLGSYSFSDFQFSGRLRTTNTDTNRDMSIIFGYQDDLHYYVAVFASENPGFTNGLFVVDGASIQRIGDVPAIPSITGNGYADFTVIRTGDLIEMYAGDVLITSARDERFPKGRVGVGTCWSTGFFDDLTVSGTVVDGLTYDVYAGSEPGVLGLVAGAINVPVFDPGRLELCGSACYWQVAARRNSAEFFGAEWAFNTLSDTIAPQIQILGDNPATAYLGYPYQDAGAEASDTTVRVSKIMLLGDSITQGNTAHNSCRRLLWHLLNAAGNSVDFVGSYNSNFGGTPPIPDFDLDHEGHWGWRADEIAAEIGVWAADSQPDVVLIHLGTNDMLQDQTPESTITDLADIVDQLRSANESVTILVAALIPCADPDTNTDIDALNAMLPAFAAATDTIESPVVFVDQNTGYDPATDSYDGLHPNASGEDKVAANWFAALQPFLELPYVVDLTDAMETGIQVDTSKLGLGTVTYAVSDTCGLTAHAVRGVNVLVGLSISPLTGFISSGCEGGGFLPSSAQYTLTNAGTKTLDWTATANQEWLDVMPSSGAIVPGNSTTVDLIVNTNANTLPEGFFSATVAFNGDGIAAMTRSVALRVYGDPSAPHSPSPIDGASGVPINAVLSWNEPGILSEKAQLATAEQLVSQFGFDPLQKGADAAMVQSVINADLPSAKSPSIADVSASPKGAGEIELVIESVPGAVGEEVTLPIHLVTNGTTPSTIDLSVYFDAAKLTVVRVDRGPAAEAAGKLVQCVVSDGRLGMVVYGGITSMSDGVMALLTFEVLSSAQHGDVLELIGASPSAATPDATAIPVTINVGHILVGEMSGCGTLYRVYFDTVNPPAALLAEGLSDPSVDTGLLSYEATYYWQVVAENCCGETAGPVWSFTTEQNPNDPPVALPDSFTVLEDEALNVAAPGVLANDNDPDVDPLAAVLNTYTSHGTLSLNADGSFTYAPNANYFGEDSFTYYAHDGQEPGNITTVIITVSPVNDPPVAESDSHTMSMNTPLMIGAPGVLANDSDVENDVLTAVLGNGPSNGTLTLNPNGSFEYVPDSGYTGEDNFTYHANDGTENSKSPATVTITIGGAPDISATRSFWYYTYASPGVEEITVTFENLGLDDLSAFALVEELPPGWAFDSLVSFNPPGCGPAIMPSSGKTGTLEFLWFCIPEFPYTFTYRVNVPSGQIGAKPFAGQVLYRRGSGAEQVAYVNCLSSVEQRIHHSLDYNPANNVISVSEILRLIQFYNMGGYHVAEGTEDGYHPGLPATPDACSVPHDSDYNRQDWKISVSEILRVIQFYNMGGYHVAEGTEDGYAAGPLVKALSKNIEISDTSSLTQDLTLPALYAAREIAASGDASDVTVTFTGVGADPISALGLLETLPEGWIFEGIVDASEPPAIAPIEGDSGELSFAWIWPPAMPAQVTYRIRPDTDAVDMGTITGKALYRTTGTEQQAEVAYGEPLTFYVDAAARKHGNGTKGKPFATISDAIEACVGGRGDTIVLETGTYREQSLVLKPWTTLVSESGAHSTQLAGTENHATLLVATEGCVVRGLTLSSAGVALHVGAGMHAEGTNCVLHTNSVGLLADEAASVVLANNTIYGNAPYGAWGGSGATFVLLANNLFAGNDTALYADPAALLNSGNNDWFGNKIDLDGPAGSVTDLLLNPLFLDESELDLRLGEDSLVRDAGDPGDAFRDTDGTRNDIGFEGGPHGIAEALHQQTQDHVAVEATRRISGDVNRDERVDAVDVQLVINAALGAARGPHDHITFANCDTDGSGNVNAVDVQIVIDAASR